MATTTPLTTSVEIPMALPCEKLWPALKNAMAIMAESCPAFIQSCEYVKGDGGVGSIRLVKFGPASGLVQFSKEEVVELDDEKMVITYHLLEGDLTNAFTLFKPSMALSSNNPPSSSILTYTLNYIPIPQYCPQIDLLNQGTTMFFKTLENFLLNSPPIPTTITPRDMQTPDVEVEPTITKSTLPPIEIVDSHIPSNLSPKSVLPPPNDASEFTPTNLPTTTVRGPTPDLIAPPTTPSIIDPSNILTITNLTNNLNLTKLSPTPNVTMNSSSPTPQTKGVLKSSPIDSSVTTTTETSHIPLHFTPSKEEACAPIPIVSN